MTVYILLFASVSEGRNYTLFAIKSVEQVRGCRNISGIQLSQLQRQHNKTQPQPKNEMKIRDAVEKTSYKVTLYIKY